MYKFHVIWHKLNGFNNNYAKLWLLWANTPCELKQYQLIRVHRRCHIFAILIMTSLIMMLFVCGPSFSQHVEQSVKLYQGYKKRDLVKIYQVMVVTVLLCGSEIWVLVKHLSKVHAASQIRFFLSVEGAHIEIYLSLIHIFFKQW